MARYVTPAEKSLYPKKLNGEYSIQAFNKNLQLIVLQT